MPHFTPSTSNTARELPAAKYRSSCANVNGCIFAYTARMEPSPPMAIAVFFGSGWWYWRNEPRIAMEYSSAYFLRAVTTGPELSWTCLSEQGSHPVANCSGNAMIRAPADAACRMHGPIFSSVLLGSSQQLAIWALQHFMSNSGSGTLQVLLYPRCAAPHHGTPPSNGNAIFMPLMMNCTAMAISSIPMSRLIARYSRCPTLVMI